MNPIYVRYPGRQFRPEYLEIIPTSENMTVQDILDYIISIIIIT